MEELDYNNLISVLNYYASITRCEVKQDTHGIMNTYQHYSYVGKQSVEMDLIFHTTESLNRFMKDMITLRGLKDEERCRNASPTVKRAYEEYQLLLKLSN